jgi:hypothetical protein
MEKPDKGRCERSADSGLPCGFDAPDNLLIVADDLLRFVVHALIHRQAEDEHVVGADAEVDVSKIPEAMDGQARPGQQRESQCELADDEQLAQAIAQAARAGPPAFLQRLSRIEARRVPGRCVAE